MPENSERTIYSVIDLAPQHIRISKNKRELQYLLDSAFTKMNHVYSLITVPSSPINNGSVQKKPDILWPMQKLRANYVRGFSL